MPISVDGNSITITGATIEVVNGNNAESGVCYLIITPDGGVGVLPFIEQGLPGQPTLFPTITYVQHPDGEALPSINPVSTLIDAGGSGVPAKYALEFHGNAGPEGIGLSASISDAVDLAASPALGVGTEKYMLLWRNSDEKWVPTALKVGDSFVASAIAATASTNTANRLLAQVTIPSQPFDWRPTVFGQTVIAGGTSTRVDIVARINDQASGAQVGFGKGLIGANAAGIQTVLVSGSPAGSAVPGSYGRIDAGVGPTTVFLRAEQKAATNQSWSTPAAPDTTFEVKVDPLP